MKEIRPEDIPAAVPNHLRKLGGSNLILDDTEVENLLKLSEKTCKRMVNSTAYKKAMESYDKVSKDTNEEREKRMAHDKKRNEFNELMALIKSIKGK